jgi:hypothetical protein
MIRISVNGTHCGESILKIVFLPNSALPHVCPLGHCQFNIMSRKYLPSKYYPPRIILKIRYYT